jgi:hypothetical protein
VIGRPGLIALRLDRSDGGDPPSFVVSQASCEEVAFGSRKPRCGDTRDRRFRF